MKTVMVGGDDDSVEKTDDDGFADEQQKQVCLCDAANLLISKFIIKCILKHVLFLFLTVLYDLLVCYWKILRNWVIIISLKTPYWC